MQGLGPFVINEISNGGAIRLETLDGEPMGTFINGSRLKRFHEPLTNEMLECMHAAKSRKLAVQKMKDEAIAEAKIWEAKAKARRRHISMVHVKEVEDEDYTEPLLLSVGISSPTIICTAICDFEANVNVISIQAYLKLAANKLLPTAATFNNFTNKESSCQGLLTTKICLQGYEEQCSFYVSASG